MPTEIRDLLETGQHKDYVQAKRMLRSLEPERTLDAITAMIRDPSPNTRYQSLQIASEDYTDHCVEFAMLLLDDSVWYVRKLACRVLWDNGCRDAAPKLVHLLMNDADQHVRYIAAFALGKLGDASAIPALIQAVKLDTGVNHEGDPIKGQAQSSIQMIIARHGNMNLPTFDGQ